MNTLIERVDVLDNKVDALTDRVDVLDNKVDAVEHRVDALSLSVNITTAKQFNSCVGRDDRLMVVASLHGDVEQGYFPLTLAHLLVAGNETLPNGEPHDWNMDRSLTLLRLYDPDYATGDDDADADADAGGRGRAALKS